MTGTSRFGDRVREALDFCGPLCVGIDPHEHLLQQWDLAATASGARELGLRVVEAAAGRVGFVKPQVSFYERHGSAGFAALEDVLAAARAAGLIVIADAKRGDIGSTMQAYAQAWLTPGSPLEADAVTASPYLGVGALEGAFTLAEQHGKGVFVLAATSNPEAVAVQRAVPAGRRSVAAAVVDEISDWNIRHAQDGSWGSVGVVIGSTVDWAEAGLERLDPPAPILGPGFGHQGAGPDDLAARFGAAAHLVIASESRSLLSAGATGIAAAIDQRVQQYGGARG